MLRTPSKRSADVSIDSTSPYASKLPKFERVGEYTVDEQYKNFYPQLQQMISGCQRKPELIPILFGKYSEAKTELLGAGEWRQVELFHPAPRCIGNLPEEFLFEFIKSVTDIRTEDLVEVNKKDSQGAAKIFSHMTQLPLGFRLEGDMLCRGVVNFLAKRRWRERRRRRR